MFGADTNLVFDAMQLVAISAIAMGSTVWLLKRRRTSGYTANAPSLSRKGAAATDLEQRVRVLERIATDRSVDLAQEIEALRADPAQSGQPEGSNA